MRIAMVILHADPTRGGAERYTLDLAQAMAMRGHDVFLLSSTAPDKIPHLPAAGPGKIIPVQLDYRGLTRGMQYIRFLADYEKRCKANAYDIVHAMLPVLQCDVYHPHAGMARAQIVAGHLKYTNPMARLLSAIGNRLNIRRRMFSTVERRLLTQAHPPIVLSLSNVVRAEVDRYYQMPDACHATLYNGVDLARYNRTVGTSLRAESRTNLGLVDTDIVALFMGQDPLRKGLPAALAALARIDDPRLKLLVVGKPSSFVSPAALQKLGLSNRVIVAGQVADPRPSYAAADFFVLPTHYDPCPLVVLEALAMGLPVISTRQNGACELMTEGLHGHILPNPDDVPALAGAMTHLLDPSVRAAMSAAIDSLGPTLSYDAHVDRLLAIYQRALDRKKS